MNQTPGSSLSLFDRLLNLIETARGSDKFLLRLGLFAVIGTAIWLTLAFNQQHSEITPTRGGTITEGILGTPRFVNPALASTRADQDVTALVYSGLMKIAPDGMLVNDLAESITTSEDGLTYNIVLRRDVQFHDATPLTAHDVAYTIRLIQDPDLKSPLRGNWTDVVVEEIGEYELNIILEEAYAPFIENFTVGIMPAHALSSLPIEQLPFSQLNTEPIGSGPFEIINATRDTSGLIEHYSLQAFRSNLSDPKIDSIELQFFQNEELLQQALHDHKIDATAYLTTDHIAPFLEEGYKLVEVALPRTFGIFFNQNRSTALRDPAVREALTAALNRDALIETALFGYGVPITNPTIAVSSSLESTSSIAETSTTTQNERAQDILIDGGWELNDDGLWEKEIDDAPVTLSFTLRTSNVPLFDAVLDAVTSQWQAIGIDVTTEQFEQTGLVQSVIRPRDFEALLFGVDMSRSYDLYPFWHSSQQDDPGLNIAQYANVEVDDFLETARTEQDETARQEALMQASNIIAKETPAIFLFQPTLTYVVDEKIDTAAMNNLGRAADRFSSVSEWHTESDSLWSHFRDDM